MSSVFLIIFGLLTVLVPHFVLPLVFFKGSYGARILSECSIWYHPELYSGIITAIIGFVTLRHKKAQYFIIPISIFTIIHAFILEPVSYYLQIEDPMTIWGQAVSLRQHRGIKYVILLLASAPLAVILLSYINERKRAQIVLDLTHLSSSNVRRKIFRSVSLVMSLSIVIGAFFSYNLINSSIESALEIGAGRLGADLMIAPEGEEAKAESVLLSGGPTMFYLKQNILQGLKEFPEIESVSPQLYIQPFTYLICCTVENFLVVAYDPLTDFTITPWIRYHLRKMPGENEMVIGNLVKFYPGQTVDLFGRKFNIVAELDPTGLGYFDNAAFIPIESAKRLLKTIKQKDIENEIKRREKIRDASFSHLFSSDEEEVMAIKDIDPEGISAIFVKAKNRASINDLSRKIKDRFSDVSVINVRESTISVKRRLLSILDTFFFPVVILLIMGTVILSLVFSMIVNERIKEIGLLRSIGAKKIDIFRIVIMEVVFLTGFGGVFGVILGGSLLFLFKNNIMSVLGLIYIWPSINVILSVIIFSILLSLSIGIFAGLYPALKASRMEPYYAIRSAE